MAYYMLIRGGLPEKRFERVEGYANHSLKDPSHPLAAENRRIEILVRRACYYDFASGALWPSLAFAVLTAAPAFADPPKISDLVDDLRRIQFRVAQGDKTAYLGRA